MNTKQLNKIVLNVMCSFFNSFRICYLSGSAQMQIEGDTILVTTLIAFSRCPTCYFSMLSLLLTKEVLNVVPLSFKHLLLMTKSSFKGL